jgi:aarF domain-containing kinase
VLTVPAVVPEHCTGAHPGHRVRRGRAGRPAGCTARPQAQRDHVALALCRLSVREFFEMRLVQTDPNFGNYLFEPASGRVALLDFGATEAVDARSAWSTCASGPCACATTTNPTLRAGGAGGRLHRRAGPAGADAGVIWT